TCSMVFSVFDRQEQHCNAVLQTQRREGWSRCTSCGLILRTAEDKKHFNEQHREQRSRPTNRGFALTLEQWHAAGKQEDSAPSSDTSQKPSSFEELAKYMSDCDNNFTKHSLIHLTLLRAGDGELPPNA